MSVQLINTTTLHTYLILLSGALFYALMLEAVNRYKVRESRLKIYSFLALATAVSAWAVKLTILRDYYQGTVGFAAETSFSSNVPLFSVIQTYVFPVVILFAIMLFLITWKEGNKLTEKESVRNVVSYLAFIGFALSVILAFLGILVF